MAKGDNHIERVLNDVWDSINKVLRVGIILPPLASTTPTIVNVSTTDATWTLVASGLTDIKSWRLVEENGNDFRYAFVAAPATYMTGFGWVSMDTPITDVYVQRISATDLDMQLLTWS